MSSKELMENIRFAKDLLIKPFFSEEGQGKQIKYVIDLKDSFLTGSVLVKGQEMDLIKEWIGKTHLVTELIFKATRDGFTASSFH